MMNPSSCRCLAASVVLLLMFCWLSADGQARGRKAARTDRDAKAAAEKRPTSPDPSEAGKAGPAALDAEKLLEEAVMSYGLADFEGSLGKLLQAQGQAKKPDLLARIQLYLAANYLDMDRPAEAEQALKAALGHDPGLKAPGDLKTSLRDLLVDLRRKSRGTLSVTANLKSAVWLDGKLLGATPMESSVPIGSHVVAVSGPGGDRRERTVVLFPDRLTRVTVTVKASSRPRTGKAPAKEAKGGRVWTWVAGAAAVAAAGTGLGMWLWSDSVYNEWEEHRSSPSPSPNHLSELEDSIRSKEIAAWALWGTGGALAATAVVLFFVEGRAEKQPPKKSTALLDGLTLTPLAGQAQGLMLRGSF